MSTVTGKKKVFVQGAISTHFIAESIQKHQNKMSIGAHDIFLGQVRADDKEKGIVQEIEYSAYEDMAESKIAEIREDTLNKYNLTCIHIYHSLGRVKVGDICFFVFVSSKHRDNLNKALKEVVERVKSEVPIFGKEVLEGEEYVWKENR
ncbi:MAG: molybdenum cofactor biosynthesis protein MoaE [Flavobacteriales bacterium]